MPKQIGWAHRTYDVNGHCYERATQTQSPNKARLEYLRGQLRAECISTNELIELSELAEYIEPGDVELLEAAGVPEFPDEAQEGDRVLMALQNAHAMIRAMQPDYEAAGHWGVGPYLAELEEAISIQLLTITPE